MSGDPLLLHIEAVLFCASEPISIEELAQGLSDRFQAEFSLEVLHDLVQTLVEKYASDDFSFGLYAGGGGYQFLTKPAYFDTVGAIVKNKVKKRLSTAAMETLAIVAYKQPISKPEIEKIRGVNCDYALQKLLEKELVELAGKSEGPGRPLLYKTSKRFMDYFGMDHLGQLPDLKDLQPQVNEIGNEQE